MHRENDAFTGDENTDFSFVVFVFGCAADAQTPVRCNCTTCGTDVATCPTLGSCVVDFEPTSSGTWRVSKQHCLESDSDIALACPKQYTSSLLPRTHRHSEVREAGRVSICCRSSYCNGEIADKLSAASGSVQDVSEHSPLAILRNVEKTSTGEWWKT